VYLRFRNARFQGRVCGPVRSALRYVYAHSEEWLLHSTRPWPDIQLNGLQVAILQNEPYFPFLIPLVLAAAVRRRRGFNYCCIVRRSRSTCTQWSAMVSIDRHGEMRSTASVVRFSAVIKYRLRGEPAEHYPAGTSLQRCRYGLPRAITVKVPGRKPSSCSLR
jgi:hypothetical protein